MSTVLNLNTSITTQSCCVCGIVFGLPTDFRDNRLADHKTWYCPSGHAQSFTGETKAEKLAKEKAQLERQLKYAREGAAWTQEQLESTRKERTVLKGKLTRATKKLAAGVCPAEGCHRHFDDLQAHVASKHPELLVAEPTDG